MAGHRSVLKNPVTGIFGLGTGWELGVIALDAYLPGELPDEPFDPENMPRMRAMVDECGRGWAAEVEAGKAAGVR